MAWTEYVGELIVPYPVYLIAQREAVQVKEGKPIIIDPDFLLSRVVIDQGGGSKALLVYLSERGAQSFLSREQNPTYRVCVFPGLSELVAFLERSDSLWILLNMIPGENDGYLIRTTRFLDEIRKGMADGA